MSIFRGAAYFEGIVSSHAGDIIPVPMPDDVEAGDYLFVIGGQHDVNVIGFSGFPTAFGLGDSSDFELITQAPYIFVKIADGTEGGTTVNFETQTTNPPFSGETRTCVIATLCYRFPVPPLSNVTAGEGPNNSVQVSQLRNIGGPPPADSADAGSGGNYPSSPSSPVEVRIVAMIGECSFGFDSGIPLDEARWYGITDRTGLHSQQYDPDETGLRESTSLTVGDQLYVGTATPSGSSYGPAGIVLSGGDETAGFLHAIKLFFEEAPLPPVECIRHVFGYATTTDPGSEYPPNQSETGGFTKTGGLTSIFPVGPVSGEYYLDGALIIATVRRFTWDSSTPPPRGTLTGFGATWDLIDYQEAVGNDSAAFVEIYRAMQPTFGPFPDDGFLIYTFPPNADRNFSSVGWKSYRGAELTGLEDNGASAIRNLTSYPVTGATSTAAFTHTAATRDDNSILWTGFWQMFDDTSGPDSFVFLAESDQILNINPFEDEGYGSEVTHQEIPPPFSSEPVHVWGTGESVNNFPWFTNTWNYYWSRPGFPRTWWAKSLEILIDPLTLCPEELAAYWGILHQDIIP